MDSGLHNEAAPVLARLPESDDKNRALLSLAMARGDYVAACKLYKAKAESSLTLYYAIANIARGRERCELLLERHKKILDHYAQTFNYDLSL